LIKAIYTASNIEADLWLLNDGVKKLNPNESVYNQGKLVFAPYESNGFNSDILKAYGYYVIDGKEEREIHKISDGSIVKYEYSEVKQLL
jgi:hypothetical protein